VLTFLPSAASATTGINNSLNYQGRLLSSSGAIVPDGYYNMEFKIYLDGVGCVTSGSAPCGGVLRYTEDWVYGTGSPDNRVKVTNGYFSVQIGTINTTLASAVDWNQNTLWMSVNIGNTSTAANFAAASGDGEMVPFKRLTAAPYALNAAMANNSLLLQGIASNQIVRIDTGGNTFIGDQIFKPNGNSTHSFQFQPAGLATTPIFNIDTINNRVGIGTATPGLVNGAALDVVGTINSSAGYLINGTAGASATCTGGQFFQNQVVNGGLVTNGTCASVSTSSALSAITAATTSHTIDSLNNDQIWNWSTASTQTAMSMSANSLTSGGLLALSSSSTGLTGALAKIEATGSNAGVTGSTLQVGMTGALSTGTAFNVTQAGSGLALRVNDDGTYSDSTAFVVDASGNVGVGTVTPTAKLDVVGDIKASGNLTLGGYLTNLDDTVPNNMLRNGSFEGGSTLYWSVTNGVSSNGAIAAYSTDSNVGAYSLRYTRTTFGPWAVLFQQLYSYLPSPYFDTNKTYTFSFYAKAISGSPVISGSIMDQDGTHFVVNSCPTVTAVTGSWTQFRCTFTPALAGNVPTLYLTADSPAAVDFLVDGFMLTPGSQVLGYSGLQIDRTDNTYLNGSLKTANGINALGGYSTNGVAGASTTCSGGQVLQNQVVNGGLTTAGSCVTAASLIQNATTSQTGLLTSTDWTTFNNKQSTLSFGNLTTTNTGVVTITGGTGAVIGSGASISIQTASGSQNGLLSSADWGTFNGKQAGLTVNGNGMFTFTGGNTLAGITCTSTGQVLTWNGSAWGCGSGSSGGSSSANSINGVIDPKVGNSLSSSGFSTPASLGVAVSGQPSIVIGNDGYPYIASAQSGGALILTRCSNFSCASSTTTAVDSNGTSPVITMGSNGFARIAYWNSGTLVFVQCTNATCSTKNTSNVITGNSYSYQPAIAMDPVTGFARMVFYYNNGSTFDKFVQCTDAACSTPVITNLTVTGGAYAVRPGIAMGSDGFARIAMTIYASSNYYEQYERCANAACSSYAYSQTLNSNGNSYSPDNYSLVLDSNGYARMVYTAYSNTTPAGYRLQETACTDINCNGWSSTNVDNNATNGYRPGLAMAKDGTTALVAYQSVTAANYLYYAQCTSTASCTTATALTSTAVNGPSLAVGSNGYARIAYYDANNLLTYLQCTNYTCSTNNLTKTAVYVATGSPSMAIGTGGNANIAIQTYTGALGLVILPSTAISSEDASKSSTVIGSDGFARIAYVDNVASALKFVQCTNVICTTRSTQTVDSGTDTGRFVSLALGSDGFARISYYDNSLGRLKLARCTNAQCSTSTITIVDNSANVGIYSSIAMGADGFARISYYDVTNSNLKYAQCTNDTCGTSVITTVDTGFVGTYTSIAVATDGFARISYYDAAAARLKFAQCTNAACTGTVNIIVVDGGTYDVGRYSSLTMGADGFARIAYYDATNAKLKFAQCTNIGCTTPSLQTVDSSTDDVGSYASVAMGASGYARISYFDATIGDLKYAVCTNATCSTSYINNVDWIGTVGYGTSIAISSATGYASISYYDTTNGYFKLWVEGSTQVAGAGGVALSQLAAALGTGNIDNGAFAQSWSWSGLNSSTSTTVGMSMSADNLVAGSVLKLSSGSASLTGSVESVVASGAGSGVTGSALAVSMTGAGNAGTALNITQVSTAGNAIMVNNGTSNVFGVSGSGYVGVGKVPSSSYALDVLGDINTSTGLRIGGAGSLTCDSTGCNDRLSFSGAGLFSRTGNAVNGITCANGQSLAFNTGTGQWTCASGTFVNTGSVFGAASSTVVDSTDSTNGYWTSQTLDTQGLSHIAYGDTASSFNAGAKEASCINTSCGNSTKNTLRYTIGGSGGVQCQPAGGAIAAGNDGFPRAFVYCSGVAPRYVTCFNATCTNNFSAQITSDTVSTSYSPRSEASMVIGTDGFARIVFHSNTTGGLKFIRCTNATCTTYTAIDISDSTYFTTYAPSMYLYSGDGTPRIAYNGYNGSWALRFIQCTSVDCSTRAATVTVDSGTAVGQQPSAAQTSLDAFPRIAYMDNNNGYIKYAKCSAQDCSTKTLSIAVNSLNVNNKNLVMRIGSNGLARIMLSEFVPVYGNYSYYFVNCSADQCANGSVTSVPIPQVNDSAADMVLNSSDDTPRIIYSQVSGNPGAIPANLVYLQCGNVSCSSGNTTTTGTENVYAGTTLVRAYMDSTNIPRVLFESQQGSSSNPSTLRVQQCGNTGCSNLGTTGTADGASPLTLPGSDKFTSVVMGTDGLPRVSVNYGGFTKIFNCYNLTCSLYDYATVTSVGATVMKIGSDGFYRLAGGGTFVQCLDAICSTTASGTVTGTIKSMQLDGSGLARLAVYTGTNLTYYQCTNASCGTSVTNTVDAATNTGSYADITLDASGFPLFAYYDSTGLNLKYAQCTNATCSSGNVNVTTVDSPGDVGQYASIALGSDGFARIAYYDNTGGNLKVAKCTNAACTTNTASTVDASGGQYISLVVDSSGFMRIAYQKGGQLKLWIESTTGSGFVALSGLGAAASGNTIDNLNFAQTWNWSTASTQTAFSMSADSLTSGSLLTGSSAATGLTGSLVSFTASGNNAGVTGNVMYLNMSGATSTGNTLKIDKAGTAGFSLWVNSGAIRFGDATNNVSIDPTTHQITLNGTAQRAKNVVLPVEYAGATLYADGTNNNGSLTAPYDLTQNENYYKWTTAQATNQDYDIIVKIPVPSDFSAWNTTLGASVITVTTKTSDTTNGTITALLKDTAGTAVTNWNTCSLTPASTSWVIDGATCAISSGTFTPGAVITLDLHLQSPLNGDTRLGTVKLNYLSKF